MQHLINDYQTAHEDAAAHLNEKREALRRAAVQRRDQLTDATSAAAHREALVNIIDDALDNADDATLTAAPLKVLQLTAGIMHPAVKSGDGNVLLEVLLDAAKGYNEQQRHDVVQAALLTASGRIDAGLYRFASPYHDRLALATLETFAGIIDAASTKRHANKRARLMEERVEVTRLADLTAAPVVVAPSLTPETIEAEPTIAIRYTQEAPPLLAGGVTLKGYGAVNHVTRDQFARLQTSQLYMSGVQCGVIEVMQP
jgi:hypothetical protein